MLLCILIYFQTVRAYINNVALTEVYFWILESQPNHVLSHITGATLQDDAIANFHFQRIVSY